MSSSLLLLLLILLSLHVAGYAFARQILKVKLRTSWYALAPCWSLFVANTANISRKSKSALALCEALWTYGVLVIVILGVQSTVGVPSGTYYLQVQGVAPGSAVDGVLEPGDVLIDIDGKDAAAFKNDSRRASISSQLQSPEPTDIGVRRGDKYQKLVVSPIFAATAAMNM